MEYSSKLDHKIGETTGRNSWSKLNFISKPTKSQKVAIFLTKIDAQIYAVVRKICEPKKLKKIALQHTHKIALRHTHTHTHYKKNERILPKPNMTVSRTRFQEQNQKRNESITQYIAKLRNLIKKFRFIDKK